MAVRKAGWGWGERCLGVCHGEGLGSRFGVMREESVLRDGRWMETEDAWVDGVLGL